MKRSQRHAHYLEELIKNLDKIGEDKRDVAWIMQEPIWFQEKNGLYRPMCDLIIGREDYTAGLVELKGNLGKRQKALSQLYSGRDFVVERMPAHTLTDLKFVVYSRGIYRTEVYDIDGQRIK